MSWLGGSISSLTGQLSNFTKEVLSEGTEEVSDHVAELSVAQHKTHNLEAQCSSQKQELQRVHAMNRELEEKVHSAELQIHTVTKEYRTLLQEKEKEIRSLQQRHQEMQDLHAQSLFTTGSGGGLPSPGYQSGFPANEEQLDFGDVISSQHEINRLSDTVRRLRAEREHWKQLASHGGVSTTHADSSEVPEDAKVLQAKVKNLELKLHSTVDEHQNELSTLQNVYADKLSAVKRKHEKEVLELQKRLEFAAGTVGNDDDDEEGIVAIRQEYSKLQETVLDLQVKHDELEKSNREKERTLQLLSRQLEKLQGEKSEIDRLFAASASEVATLKGKNSTLQLSRNNDEAKLQNALETIKKQEATIANVRASDSGNVDKLKTKLEAAEAKISELLNDREQVCCDLYATKHRLLAQLDSNHADNSEMLLEIQLARHKFASEADSRQTQVLKEKQELVNRMADLSEMDRSLEQALKLTETNVKTVSSDAKKMIEQLGDPEHQQLVLGMIHALELENKILKQQNASLQSQMQVYRKLIDITEFPGSKTSKSGSEHSEEGVVVHRTDSDKTLEEFKLDEMASLGMPSYKSHPLSHKKAASGSFASEPSESANQLLFEFDECETSSLNSTFSELSLRNKELDDQVKVLQSQIESHERDIEHFEMVKSDWQMEKKALEEILSKLRTQLRAKEASLTLVTAQRGLLEVRKQTPRTSKENVSESNSPELNFEQELEKLQEQIEELAIGSSRLENERDILLLEKDKILEELHKMNVLNQELKIKLATIEKDVTEANRTDDVKKQDALHARVVALENEVASLSEEKNALMLSLEELDQQHQVAIEKILESRDLLLQKAKDAVTELESLKEQLKIQQRTNVEMEAKLQQSHDTQAQVGLLSETDLLKQKIIELSEASQQKEHTAQLLQDQLKSLHAAMSKTRQEKELSEGVVQTAINQIFQHLGKENSVTQSTSDPHELLNLLEELFHTLQDLERSMDQLQSERCELMQNVPESVKCKEELGKDVDDERTRSLWEVESWEEIVDDVEKSDKEVLGKTKLQDLELASTSSKQSKDSSEDSHEKYGELVQRKEDLEVQVKELESQLAALQAQKQSFDSGKDSNMEGDVKDIAAKELELRLSTLEHDIRVKEESLAQLQNDMIIKCEENDCLRRELEKSATLMAHFHSKISKHDEGTSNILTRLEYSAGSDEAVHDLDVTSLKLSDSGDHATEVSSESSNETDKGFVTMSANELEVQGKITELEANSEDLKQQLLDVQNQNALLSEAKSELDSVVSGLQNDLLNYERTLSELNAQNKQLLKEVAEYKEKQSNAVCKQDNISKEESEKSEDGARGEKLYEANISSVGNKDSENLEIQLQNIRSSKDAKIQKLVQEVTVLKDRVEELELSRNGSEKSVSEEQLRSLNREKEQILSVLNEKSRENSSLKTEVHRLMNVVCTEKATVSQLQHGNQEFLLKSTTPSAESTEMNKEAVQNLSRIIRDKDVEIEALGQKNQTLLAVLQQSSSEGSHLQSILQEKENLMKQLSIYQGEREQLIVAVNQKHHESMSYHAEIQRLTSILSTETHKMVQLQQQHSTIARQYEDKQKTLLNTQNELIILKQRVSELEEQQMDLKVKCAAVRNERNAADAEKALSTAEVTSTQVPEAEKASKSVHDKNELLFEKDKLLLEYQQQIQHLQEDLSRKTEELSLSKRQSDSFTVQLSSLQSDVGNYKREYDIARQRLEEGSGEITVMKDTNNRLSMAIQEKDFELQAVREKVATLTLLLQQRAETSSDVNSSPEMKRLLSEGEEMQRKAQQFQHERDQVMLALSQRQQENKEFTNALRATREREERLQHELERLRTHLLQVEESYTQEALHAEEREKELRTRLVQAEEKARNASSSFSNASYQANLQVESLQEQLHTIAHQRDSALLKLDSTEDQVQQLTASLQTLQVVLEQFQQEKERELTSLRGQFENVLRSERQKSADLQQQIQDLENRLVEAADALDAATRLSEQIDLKESTIVSLKQEVSRLESSLRNAHDETTRAASSNEGKVDRSIIKNLLVNYFSVTPRQKPQVLRIMATVLDFNQEERIKSGLESSSSGWISSWLGRSPTQSTPRKEQIQDPSNINQSLSAAFIQFLQEESRPFVALKLPAESMAQELTRKSEQQHVINPFAAPSAPVVLQWPGNEADPSSHLLMKPMLTTLPTFTPMPVCSQSNVLRDVLKRD